MREIKFRAKDYTGEWRYGCLLERKYFDFKNGENVSMYYISSIEPDWTNSNVYTNKEYLVISNTIGQYTGLKDTNGKKIYEGDIILSQKMSDRPFSKKAKSKRLIGHVIYDIEEGFGFYNEDTKEWNVHKQYGAKYTVAFGKEQYKYRCIPWGEFYDCEVIGNIYDNPELVEASNED